MNFFKSIAVLASVAGVAASLHAAEIAAPPRPVAGWRMELLLSAPTLRHPTVVCTAPDGRIFVAEDPMDISTSRADATEGSIKCLHSDGRVTVFATNLHAAFGMQYLEGKLFVLHNPQFSVFKDAGAHGTNRADLISQTHPNPSALNWNDHVPSNFRLALDGYFYGATGDKGLFGATGTDGRRLDMQLGGVFRIRPDGTGLEKFCDGVRNILDVARTSEDDFFTYDNTDEHEWMGRLTHMVDGGFYGYPFDFIPRRPYTLWMLADYGPGAATGAFAYTDDAMPTEFQDNLFLADFGQRNIRRVILERAGGTFREVRNELLFVDSPADFRPVGIHETEDGRSLLICDWQHLDNKQNVTVGRLWRLTNEAATNAAPRPVWFVPAALGKQNTATDEELLSALAHPARRVRLTAQRELERRVGQASSLPGGTGILPSLEKLAANTNLPALTRIHALWTLTPRHNDPKVARTVEALLDDRNRSVSRQAMRWLGEQRVQSATPIIARQLTSNDPSIRFQAATALGRIADAGVVAPLLAALAKPEAELWPRYAMFTALNRIGPAHPDAWPQIVRGLDAASTTARDAIRFALRETFEEKLVEALAKAARDTARPVVAREAALRLLAAVHRKPPEWKGDWWAYHPFRLSPPARTVDWTGTPIVLAALRTALDEGDNLLSLAAIEGLQTADDRESAAKIRALGAKSPSSTTRAAALRALGDFADDESVALLVPLVEGTSVPDEERMAAFEAAGKLCAAVHPAPAPLVAALLRALTAETTPERARLDALEAVARARLTNATAQLVIIAQSPAPALREASIRALTGFGAPAALAPLSQLIREAPIATRREAITALGSLRDKSALPLLLDASKQPDTSNAAWAALTVLPSVEAVPAYLDALGTTDAVLREKARRALGEISETALSVIEARAGELSPGIRAELRRVYEGNIAALAKPFLAVTNDAPPSADDFAKYALTATGDAWRGQKIFFDEQRVACIRCHAVHGWGGDAGPELTTAGAQFGRTALIESVLFPSKTVREGYQQVEFELRNGESLSGIVKAESGTVIKMIETDGRSHELRHADIASRRASKLSMMPDGLQAVLSLGDFADLIAYLESLKTDPRHAAPLAPPDGWQPLFNGRDLSGWHSVEGREATKGAIRPPQHWAFHDGILEHDGLGSHLWTDREFRDFALRFDWRWVDAPKWEEFPIINADGFEARGPAGVVLHERVLDCGDSGVFVRGHFPAQANLFCYPVGSGEFWELREAGLGDAKRAFTPRQRADRPLGQWNRMELTVRGDTITVVLNGEEVISSARSPGLPARGPVGFQHEHGRLQIANVFLREL